MLSIIESEPQLDHTSSLSCTSVRLIIRESASHFQSTELMLDVDDPGYHDQDIQMSNDLTAASEAYEKRPIDCVMTVNSDDCYGCDRCSFRGDLSLPAQGTTNFEY